MSWGIMRALVAILFASHVLGMTPSSEVTRLQLATHQQPPLQTWDQTVETVMAGKASLIGRTNEVIRARQRALGQYDTPESITNHVCRMLNWRDSNVLQRRSVWDNDAMSNDQIVKWHVNDFPYRLPHGVKHWLFWFRVQCVCEESFMKNGRHAFSQPADVLMRYILHYDFFGGYGISTQLGQGVRRLEFQHPTDDHIWEDPITKIIVRHKDGVEAMRCAGQRINEIFQRKFPAKQYEVVWNRSPERYKSIVNPDHFHVFVRLREPHTEKKVLEFKESNASKLHNQ